MGFFSNNNLYSQKQVGYGRRSSQAMKDLLGKKGLANILDKPAERNEFYQELKKKAPGGVSRNEMREILGHFRYAKGKTIDKYEAEKMATKIMPNDKKYIIEK